MGKSNPILMPIYNDNIPKKAPHALLGFRNNDFNLEDVDLYDLSLENWDINADWKLDKKYGSIISTRCPYFAKNPKKFIQKCYENLVDGGEIFLDWGLGDHWRFKNYKIGWTRNGEHEWFYDSENYLWSTVWDDEWLTDPHLHNFMTNVEKKGYNFRDERGQLDPRKLKTEIFREVPEILDMEFVRLYFDVRVGLLSLWPNDPQLYIFIRGKKK